MKVLVKVLLKVHNLTSRAPDYSYLCALFLPINQSA